MKRLISALLFLTLGASLQAQLSGNLNVPQTYTSIASVIMALNQQGVSGSVTVNIAAGYTETAVAGGFSLTASGSSLNPIVFRKSGIGSNPLIIAYTGGIGTPGSMNQDGIWRLIGCDFVTIDGIDLVDPNISNPSTMEFGFGLFKASTSDGCQNNTIKNCSIILNRINNASGSGPVADGSRGIDVVNASVSVHNASISVSSSAGSHSNNKFLSNTIRNCNTGISLVGFMDSAPFTFADHGNEIGGNSIADGNRILDFGGGGSTNAAIGIASTAQYDLKIGYNQINNNSGAGVDHPGIIRAIDLGAATGADVTVINNTLTLHGGGTSSQITAIVNAAGSGASSNTVSITNNLITDCTYNTSTSGAFYGIWNTASPATLSIAGNIFSNNSTGALSGSTYLIYNNGAVSSFVDISNNDLSFSYVGISSYSGSLYSVFNNNGTMNTRLNISSNRFADYNYLGYTGTGNLYFIYNTNDSYAISIENNSWNNLFLNHSGAEYLINNNSATQTSLSVCNNSISTGIYRTASAGATYLYYSTGNTPTTCAQTFSGNIFSNISGTISGTGNFYGLYTADGTGSPYPRKAIFNNVISQININSTGNFYGYYLDNLGDAGGTQSSSVHHNTLAAIYRSGPVYGMYLTAAVSPSYAPLVYNNCVYDLNSSGPSSTLYGAYLSGGGAGLSFTKNKIGAVVSSGSMGIAHGVYVNSANTTTLANNMIGGISAPNSNASNAVNGIYINSGTLLNLLYNSVYLNAVSSGGNFNSNALYASSTVSLALKNNILINQSVGGTGIAAAFRKSSSSLTNYLPTSGNNLFYAGTPSSANILLQNGTTAYQTLSAFQTAVSPREVSSVTQNVQFMSTLYTSPNFLRPVPTVSLLTESGALTISGIAEDYDTQIRYGAAGYAGTGTAPDIGADEYDQNLVPCSSASAGTLLVNSFSLCAGQSVTLVSSGYTPGTGLLHAWKMSTSTSSSYSMVIGGSGSLTPEFTSLPLQAGTYYFLLETICVNNSLSAVSSAATVVVNPIPTITAQVTNTLICAGQSLSLTGLGGGTTYQWIGPNGFNSTAQNPVVFNANTQNSGIYYLTSSANNCSSAQSSVAVSVSETTINLTASSTNMCLGASTTLSVSTSAITYTWSNTSNMGSISVSPSVTTLYSVSVTNTANCVSTRTILISVINPSISANNTVACGSSATVTLSVNAFTPSTVNWYVSPTATVPINSGISYSISISSSSSYYAEAINPQSGCLSPRVPVTVTLSPFPSVTVVANPSVICPGSSSTVTAQGASTYSWTGIGSGSFHVVSPTSIHVYTVVAKSTLSCASTQTLLVDTYTLPILTVAQTATAVCPSSVVGFTASGAVGYFWSTGANGPVNTVTPAISSSYTVYGISSESCTVTKTLSVNTRSVPVISVLHSTDSLCPGELITFTAMGANSYTWFPGAVVSASFSAAPLVPSVYNAIGRSINTCTNVGFASVFVSPCTSLSELKQLRDKLFIFPNPSTGRLNVRIDFQEEFDLLIFSSLGHLVFATDVDHEVENLDISFLPKGIYTLKIRSPNISYAGKLILY